MGNDGQNGEIKLKEGNKKNINRETPLSARRSHSRRAAGCIGHVNQRGAAEGGPRRTPGSWPEEK